MIKFISNTDHYEDVIHRCRNVNKTLWIGTASIITNETPLVDAAFEQFDSVWRGSYCTKCKRKDFCGDRIK